jgi:sulfatase maturation enzyme AslB (radical SAM superfamily)
MSKTFCIAPWQDVHVVTDGGFKGCCVMEQRTGKYFTDGKDVNITQGINAGLNSDTAKEIRLDSLNNKWHTACARCEKEEMSGMKSMRLLYEDRWKDKFSYEDALAITDTETGELPDDHVPFFYDIQLGNLCNLKCRICHPVVSSSWIPDFVKLNNLPEKFRMPLPGDRVVAIEHVKGKQYNIEPSPFAWAESDEFWEEMSERKSKMSHLYLIGGEPMMIHRHFDFLKECIDSGDAKHITLQYDTNLTNLPKKVMKYWTEFEKVMIGFSIDGMGPELEYMRNPIKWKQMLKNISIVDEFGYANNDRVQVYDSVTVSIYNVIHVLDYIEWKVKAGKDTYKELWQEHKPNFGVHPLHTPSHLSVQTIPHDAKTLINAKYSNWRTKMLAWVDSIDKYSEIQTKDSLKYSINEYVDTWIGFINQNDNSKQMNEFWDYTNKLDEIRDESFSDVFPQLSSLLEMK